MDMESEVMKSCCMCKSRKDISKKYSWRGMALCERCITKILKLRGKPPISYEDIMDMSFKLHRLSGKEVFSKLESDFVYD